VFGSRPRRRLGTPSDSDLPDDHRRAPELLAGTTDGYTEAVLMARGLSGRLLAELILAGLATADTERSMASGKPVEVRRIRITAAGWRALER
jgi:hypothetical protein